MQSEAAPARGWERRYTLAAGLTLSGMLTLGGAWFELSQAVQDAAPQFHAQGPEKDRLQDRQHTEALLWACGNLLAISEFVAAGYCARGGWERFMRYGQPLGGEAASPPAGQAAEAAAAVQANPASAAPIAIPQPSH